MSLVKHIEMFLLFTLMGRSLLLLCFSVGAGSNQQLWGTLLIHAPPCCLIEQENGIRASHEQPASKHAVPETPQSSVQKICSKGEQMHSSWYGLGRGEPQCRPEPFSNNWPFRGTAAISREHVTFPARCFLILPRTACCANSATTAASPSTPTPWV